MGRDVSGRNTSNLRAWWRPAGGIWVVALGIGALCAGWLTVASWTRNSVDGAGPSRIVYGAHLAQECLGCHRPGSKQRGIPPIDDLSVAEFRSGLKAFQTGKRDNPTMVSVARSLDDAQIEALAQYFQSQRAR